ARRPQAVEHLLQQRQDRDGLFALLRRHVEPEPGQGLIQFLSGHRFAPRFLSLHPKPSWPGLSRPSTKLIAGPAASPHTRAMLGPESTAHLISTISPVISRTAGTSRP